MPKIIWSDASLRDLSATDLYISNENGEAALNVLRRIRSTAAVLESFPAAGPVLDGEQRYLNVRGTRYVIVYRIGTERGGAGRVEVIRVRHAREDWFPAEQNGE